MTTSLGCPVHSLSPRFLPTTFLYYRYFHVLRSQVSTGVFENSTFSWDQAIRGFFTEGPSVYEIWNFKPIPSKSMGTWIIDGLWNDINNRDIAKYSATSGEGLYVLSTYIEIFSIVTPYGLRNREDGNCNDVGKHGFLEPHNWEIQ